MVDAPHSKCGTARCVGSSPTGGTIILQIFINRLLIPFFYNKNSLGVEMNDPGSRVEVWSKTRSAEPVQLSDDLSIKNQRLLDPLASADFYFEFYDGKAQKVVVHEPGGAAKYELVANLNNPESGFHAKVVRNPETGHHVILIKGTDLVGRDEGAGPVAGAPKDAYQLAVAQYGCLTDQVLDAEKAYIEWLQKPEIASLEIIGYSIGSIPANYLASVYDAKASNVADLGVPGTGPGGGAKRWLAANFNTCAHGLFPGATGEFRDNLKANVVGLKLRMDAFGGPIGDAGDEFGARYILDTEDLNLLGVGHIPEVYANTVKEAFPQTPEVRTVETVRGPLFAPFKP
jgi:hypothetical protein